jgi:hypothetical protein
LQTHNIKYHKNIYKGGSIFKELPFLFIGEKNSMSKRRLLKALTCSLGLI